MLLVVGRIENAISEDHSMGCLGFIGLAACCESMPLSILPHRWQLWPVLESMPV